MRSIRLLATLAAGALTAVAGCTVTVNGSASPYGSSVPSGGGRDAEPVDPLAPVPDPPSAQIGWYDCNDLIDASDLSTDGREITFECGSLVVPLDYANPDAKTLTLLLVKGHLVGAPDGATPLVINPGGPGGSGANAGIGLAYELPLELMKSYDVIGFDPRGVGESAPVQCIGDKQRDELAASDPTPDDAAEEKQYFDDLIDFSKACAAAYPGLEYINTVATARDLDQIRDALGEQKLTYLGYSYGTELGAAYAVLFPDKVGRFVLDGAVDLTIDEATAAEQQLAGFEQAFQRFVDDCIAKGSGCPIAPDPQARALELMSASDGSPIPSTSDGRKATEGIVRTAFAAALYDEASWPDLAAAIQAALNGDSAKLFELADAYNGRYEDGTDVMWTNIVDANTTISCNDSVDTATDAEAEAEAKKLSEEWAAKYPVFGESFGWGQVGCAGWDQRRHPLPEVNAPKTDPILVVGTKNDPATPYSGAVNLAAALGPQTGLLTYDGDGHTAFPSTECVNNAVLAYLKDGTMPAPGSSCPAA